ncbi:MAG: putative Ig domain-containing protein [Bryobacteraceae bacterium]
MKSLGLAFALASTILAANLLPATGNVILTGEDADYHAAQPPGTDPASPDAITELTAIVTTVRNGSPNPSLPILILAQPGDTSVSPPRSYLAQALDNIGIPACPLEASFQPTNCYILVDPVSQPIPEFTVTAYSAVGVASANSGGTNGDNSSEASTAINAASSNFQSFINSGGGVFALSSKGSLVYYNFLESAPFTYTIIPGQPVIPGYPPGFSNGSNQATTGGLQIGVPVNSIVNGHNLFDLAISPVGWQALETYTGQDTYFTYDAVTNQPITIALLHLTVVAPTSFAASTGVRFSGTLGAVSGHPPYNWQISGQPSWLAVDPITGSLSGTPATAGSYTFTATVTDSAAPASTAQIQVTISVAAHLQVVAPTNFAGIVGVPFSATLAAANGTSPYNWQISGQPSWLTINAATGVLSGTPAAAGPFTFTATVTDSGDPSSTAQAQVTITVVPQLQVVSSTTFAGIVGVPFSVALAATGGTSPYSWHISGQPAWLTINPGTGALSGTPVAAGSFAFTATVTDSGGAISQTAQAQISITAVPKLQIVPPTTFAGAIGVPFSGTLTATGGTPPYNWEASGQPAWLTINPTTGVLSGTPTSAGPFTFVVTVSDSGVSPGLVAGAARRVLDGAVPPFQTAQASVTATIVSAPLVVPPAAAFTGTVGVSLNGSLTATGGTTPYTWQATGLPPGLNLSANGTLSGTPTASGTFKFTANVTDGGTPIPETGSTAVTVSVGPPYVPTGITLTIQPGTAQPTLTVSAMNTSDNNYAAVLSITPPNEAEFPGPAFAASSARMLCFVIPANSSGPVTLPDAGQFSEGSVAGTLTINMTGLSMGGACSSNQETSQGGADVAFALPEPVVVTQTLQRSVPVITSVVFTGSAGSGITVTVIGSSNTQELVSASFTFTAPSGDQLNGAVQTVSLAQASSAWFATSTYGGAFQLTLTFPYTGSASAFPTSVSAVLVNSVGSSAPVTNSK